MKRQKIVSLEREDGVKIEEKRDLVIDRSKWGTGRLLTNSGKMCCLGFLSAACGVPARALLDTSFPNDLLEFERIKIPSVFLGVMATQAASINDSARLTVENKMEKLKIIFASCGYNLIFAGEGEPI